MQVAPPESERRFDLLGLGECMVEFYAAQPLGVAKALQRGYGGDVLNSLVAAARLGARTGFITRVGNDPFGAGLREAWIAEGVDVEQAPLAEGDNGVYFISVADDGEREFSYRRQGTPASRLGPDDLDEDYIASSRCLLLSGITQALSASAREATLAAARMASQHGVQVAYDPNYRPRLWESQGGLAAARDALDALLPYADWVLPSHPADAVLLGETDDMDAFAVASAFARRCPNVALKCGPDGCIIATAWHAEQVPGVAAKKLVDTTGAGDLWNGSFLVCLQRGMLPSEAARVAHRLAAAKLAHRGAIPPRSSIKAS
jgi:2-dehydro-3-deoxygluconokinase